MFKRIAIFKNIGLGLIFLLGIVACEKDLEDIAVDLTGQRPFDVGDSIFEVIAYHRNIDSSRVDNNEPENAQLNAPLGLLGVNSDMNFGTMNSDLISQVLLPLTGADFGDNAIIDRVVLDIPYFATRDGDQGAVDPDTGLPIFNEGGDTLQVPNFTLDSIYGNEDLEYQIAVFELGTFLNSLDPDDPTKPKSYYSDKEYILKDELFSGEFKPNRNDTVLYVERRYLDGDPSTVDDIDTIKTEAAAPSIKFDLDEQFFKERFVDHDNPFDFENNGNFVRYFRGLYIEAEGFDGALLNLQVSNGAMTIYYTNEVETDEGDDEDLNGNGINGEENVIVKTKQAQRYNLGGVRTSKYIRNYAGSAIERPLTNPDTDTGEAKLYLQGAAGSEIILEVLDEETVDYLRQQNFLINEANLVFYLDGDQREIPTRLLLYKYDFNSFIDDFYSFRYGADVFGGELEYDDEGNPEKYKFRITEFMNRALKGDDPIAMSRLALKNLVNTDFPQGAVRDTTIKDWNWIPKGVILHGNKPKSNEKRIKLEMFYSK
ncbi:MAG: DUF4270 domain-containing protein [Flavobacteriaceae bacterium]|nr:MAG: DUF4270 domain-containing protein [Flavobacteriaceae bacterium]